MRYKIMVKGAAYKARYANGSYVPDISESGSSSTKRRSFSAEVTPADTYAYIDVSDCATGTWSYTITTNSASKEGSFSIPLPNAKKQELILGEFGGVATLTYKVNSGGTSNLTSLQHSSSDPKTTITAQIM